VTDKFPPEQEGSDAQPPAEPIDAKSDASELADDSPTTSGVGQIPVAHTGWVAPLALILAVGGGALSAYTWYATHVAGQLEIGRELGRLDGVARDVDRLVTHQSQVSEAVATLRRQGEDDRNALRSELQALTQAQAAERAQRQKELESLAGIVAKNRSEMGVARDDWLLQEVAHLLLLANQRLALTGDVVLAQKALALADDRLKALAGPQILKIRRVLSQEQEHLGQMTPVDVAGISLVLAALAESVGDLPLKGDSDRPQWSDSGDSAQSSVPDKPADDADSESAVRAFSRKVLSDLGDLVRVRRVDETRPPKLDTAARFLAYENLRLQLVGAQLALLRRDAGVFQENLKQARIWLGDYFETGTPVQHFDTQVAELQQSKVALSFPDISGSLALLRAEIQRRDSIQ
jgi:uroporphyrinogen III methyltransferase/synthase|tara:strand:- start:749 stop:1966 length:1218 start_codon:yes stop_codon:yes gene_type:complete